MMKQRLLLFSGFLFILALTTSCTSSKSDLYVAEVQTLDTLIQKLETLKAGINAIDTARLNAFQKEFYKNYNYLDSVRYMDTTPKADKQVVGNYVAMRGSMKKFYSKVDEHKRRIDFSLTQTSQLKKDFENGVVAKFPENDIRAEKLNALDDKDRAKNYMETETREVTSAIDKADRWLKRVSHSYEHFETSNQEIQEIIQRIKTNTKA